MAKIYNPSEFLKEKKLREIPVEFMAKFKEALSNHLPPKPNNDPEANYEDSVKSLLEDTFYKGKNKIARKKDVNTDLNIFEDNTTTSFPIVLIEMKRPSEKNDMLSKEDLNRKALHELIFYYLTELEGPGHNNAIRYLIASNGYDWFIFEETMFRRLFSTKKFKQEFKKVNPEGPTFYKEKTKEFYAYVAKEIENEGLTEDMACIYFSLKDWDKMSDQKLSAICRLLSPYFLLGKRRRDANDMNDEFYKELLYIIGLEERSKNGNTTIQRLPEERREAGSLVESAMSWLVAHDDLSDDEKYDAALELVLTWVNRLLFIKLVESQVISFNSWDEPEKHSFFNEDKIKTFRHIDDLFFKVLALPKNQRDEEVNKIFGDVPYLNSKLFECTYLERHLKTSISFLKVQPIKLYKDTVLTNGAGRRIKGEWNNISYLIAFLAKYNFGEPRKDDTRELINASVLGKIFEKINGYKDGAVFTPASVTNFICKETLERSVVEKLNVHFGCQCQNLQELVHYIPKDGLRQVSDVINEIRVLDPAVGSGHFLVSALNRLIAIKAELGVLLDENDQPLTLLCNIGVTEDDELEIKFGSQHFLYKKGVDLTTRIQKALFCEKAAIIEHCLFGVDINPKSVDICQLRLWIELLKNAYYTDDELITLPNIDINIKQGDSLLHNLPLDADITETLKSHHVTISTYKEVNTNYKTANKQLRKEYNEILKNIQKNILYIGHDKSDRLYGRKARLEKELDKKGFIGYVHPLFHHEEIDDEKTKEEVCKIAAELEKVNALIEERKRIYEDAFEWRYMFPDVLADDGSFVGFDCIIGNPPYIQLQKMGGVVDEYDKKGYASFARTGDISVLFYEWCMSLLRQGGYLTFITTNSWMRADYGRKLQKFFESDDVNPMMLIDFFTFQVFRDVTVRTNILMLHKAENQNRLMCCTVEDNKAFKLKDVGKFYEENKKERSFKGKSPWVFVDEEKETFVNTIRSQGTPLEDWVKINYGIKTGYHDAFWISSEQYQQIISRDEHCKEILEPHLRGRNIKKYLVDWEGYYLINSHNGLKEENLPPIDINDYMPVKEHLDTFYDKLEARTDKGDTPYNLRNCAYLKDFEKKKIIYPNLTTRMGFYLDNEGYYVNEKAYMIVGKHLGYLTAFFNSVLFRYCFTDNFPLVQGDGRELRKSIFLRIPVKDVTDEEDAEYERRVMEIQQMKRDGLSTEEKEHELDLMILAHYGITAPEQQSKFFLKLNFA
ncbi:MAG: Eco57I restriction-modification methylase domain-containing protein [Prevotella sp.]|nr:Eco57I restriction-modification methylase domain-containing protein [Prevotella sp.]